MKTLIMGGGIIGVTTAYFLARAGHEVTVVERNDGPGEETSFQNGALLAPGHSQSFASPGAVWTLLSSLMQKDPALRFRFSADPRFLRWALRFLGQCTTERYRANTLRVFRCMHSGLDLLRDVRTDTGIDDEGHDDGVLYVFRTRETLEKKSGNWTLLIEHGYRLEEADRDRCVAIEPALEISKDKIAGGFFAPDDGAGDAYVFTCKLAEYCKTLGVHFQFDTTVNAIKAGAGSIEGIITNRGELNADDYVLALGPYSPMLARPLSIDLPIWPIKGYTVSIPISGHNGAPRVGVIEEDNLVAFAPLHNRLRIGGKADFAGYNTDFEPGQFRGVFAVARDLFPDGGEYAKPTYWACLRPVTPGGPPILGKSPYRNLYLNVGHGAAGWTMACATSKAVADIVCGRMPELDMEGLTLES